MADLKELADAAAKVLLKAIRDQAPKANDSKLLNLAQAYSLVVSAEVTVELVDDGETLDAEQDDDETLDAEQGEPGQSTQEPTSQE
ncbi:hypothetical protein [Mycobacterium sp.]|uniref:hypothetical protein n=1 Tax=Mycobacterium sp. TaxID=1785 RepID=UPI003C791EFE